MTTVHLHAPFNGWAGPLEEVPDPVFAERMMGDGLALDPFDGEVRAPCDGVVVAVAPTRHSVTLRTGNGAEILIHVGLETVALSGEGFELLVREGDEVKLGQLLLRVDLDAVARRAKSLMTPILVTGDGFRVEPLANGRVVQVGEPILAVTATATAAALAGEPTPAPDHLTREIVVPLAHGFHARPAARIGAALKPFAADLRIACGGRSANARSVVALLGLGVAHGDRVLLSAQGPDARAAIETVAELIEGGMGEAGPPPPDTVRPSPVPAPAGTAVPTGSTELIAGIRAAPGLAVGTATHLRAADLELPERGADPATERARLDQALTALAAELAAQGGTDGIAIAHAALLEDPELRDQAHIAIAGGAPAPAAWRSASRVQEEAIRATGDVRLMERTADLRDVERQVIARLIGASDPPPVALPPAAILLADELFPSQFTALDRTRLAGICTAGGGPTSHVAILAASAGVPMMVAAGSDVLDLPEGAALVLDADAGTLRVADAAATAAARAEIAARRNRSRRDTDAAQAPCVMADGTRIDVFANCGSADDAAQAVALGAEGCGLLRTEFLFLGRDTAPTEGEQATAYAAIAAAMGNRPLIVRTLDVGGDKPVPFLALPAEENPALGQRGVRISLARPELLISQLRAILTSVPAAQCRIMLPMVVDVTEYRAARAVLADAAASVGAAMPPLGIMVETPAAALLANSLAAEADFLSIGSNDLTQYALAADRGNPTLASRIDALHPAVLRLIGMAGDGARAHGRWLGVCGGVASDAAAAALLIGLGVTELSAAPTAIPALKAVIRGLDLIRCRTLAARARACATAAEVRRLLEEPC